ncbi:hypothetical protein PR202_gn00882 [Eleusine coracana subsp. coracana]|uniref:Core Histone H2A/H2B/H3 domain-containing protein n=1 Tax=Eleusine coracana subsp. coracana TaxID=191504 RepID=A0AAV5G4D7_ELECO|nr:hypothetical protein PR202_gn00882 [Eleusine coracana subsp. coracana]
MEPSSQPQPAMGVAAGGSQVYPSSAYPPAATIAAAPAVAPPGSQPVPPFPANSAQMSSQHQLVYQQAQQFHQQLQQQQQRQLQQFWAERLADIEQTTDFKNHTEAPVVFAKACEIFILELTLRSWMHTEENKRRTLQKNDIAAAITRTDIYDFLVDIVPRDDDMKEGVGLPRAGVPPIGGPADAYPYYYVPQQQIAGAGMVYGGQQGHPVTYMWPETHEQQDQQGTEDQRSLHEKG